MAVKRKVEKNIKKVFAKGALYHNPLLIEAVGISPVVAIAVSLKTAAYLALITMVLLIVAETLTSLFLKKLPRHIRIGIYMLIGTAVVIPFVTLVEATAVSNIGLFLPLVSVNSIIVLHCERYAIHRNVKLSIADSLASGIGYGVVVLVVGFLRELLGSGSVFGVPVASMPKSSGILMPFGGFIVLGFLAALLKTLLGSGYYKYNSQDAFELTGIDDLPIPKYSAITLLVSKLLDKIRISKTYSPELPKNTQVIMDKDLPEIEVEKDSALKAKKNIEIEIIQGIETKADTSDIKETEESTKAETIDKTKKDAFKEKVKKQSTISNHKKSKGAASLEAKAKAFDYGDEFKDILEELSAYEKTKKGIDDGQAVEISEDAINPQEIEQSGIIDSDDQKKDIYNMDTESIKTGKDSQEKGECEN